MRRNSSEGRGSSREDSTSDKKKAYGSKADMPPQEFRKYRNASKSEEGWKKPDGKTIRKRVDKDKVSAAKTQRREDKLSEEPRSTKPSYRDDASKGEKKFSRERSNSRDGERKPFREKSFGADRRTSGDGERRPFKEKSFGGDRRTSGDGERKPSREKSFGGDSRDSSDGDRKPFNERSERVDRSTSSDGERKPFREKSFGGDRRASSDGERKPFRDKSFGGDRKGDRNDRKSSGEREYRSEKKSSEAKPFGTFYKEKRSFSKNKKARADGFSNPPERKYDDRPAAKFDSREKRTYVKKEYKPREERSKPATSTPKSDTNTDGIRLNRFIANSGICSRREADELIEAGVISVNGNVVIELGTRVTADDDIRYNGERMKSEKLVYLVLNKPKDYITTTDDPMARKTVMELVSKACKERIYPVGRLDRNTTGLLMLTNDGEMTKKLTHPASNIFKVYHVELDKPLKTEHMRSIAEGVELEDGFMKVDEIAYDGTGSEKNMIGVEIHSGKNHIVRRLFEHFEYEVRKLDRVIFAGLTKKDLPRGHWRFLTEDEVNMLKVMTGSGKSKKPEFRKPRSKSETES